MFIAEALDGDATRLSDEQIERLKRLDALTPGDFASVKRQIDVLGEAFAPLLAARLGAPPRTS